METLFEQEETIKDEFNPNFFIKTPLQFMRNKPEYRNNNYGFLNKDLDIKKISKFKFSRIDNFRVIWLLTTFFSFLKKTR